MKTDEKEKRMKSEGKKHTRKKVKEGDGKRMKENNTMKRRKIK